MDVRKVFEAISLELTANFNKSVQIKHSGGKGSNREDTFVEFLKDYLPGKYGVGRGEVITSENDVSGELDIVIYDKDHCPLFIKSDSHSIYPRESVFGAISMKSHLDSEELKDAYNNIVSLKKIMPEKGFSKSSNSGMISGFSPVVPVTAIFAYSANRSLEAIAKQVKELDKGLENLNLRPDFVVVLGLGIVGPEGRIRNQFNQYNLPDKPDRVSPLRAAGRHTLLRFYMQFLDELNSITQPDLDLNSYFNMPSKVGKYKVRKHDHLAIQFPGESEASVKKITFECIDRIVNGSIKVTLQQHYLNHLGSVPQGMEEKMILSNYVYEYNPENKPPIQFYVDDNGKAVIDENCFQPFFIYVDGNGYAIDFNSLSKSDFEDNPDFTIDELFSS